MNVRDVRRWKEKELKSNGAWDKDTVELVVGRMEDLGFSEATDFEGYAELIHTATQYLTAHPDPRQAHTLRLQVKLDAERLLSEIHIAEMDGHRAHALVSSVRQCLGLVKFSICGCFTTAGAPTQGAERCQVCDDRLVLEAGPFNPGSKPV